MKFTPSLVALVLSAATVNAQQTRTRPAPATPPAAPAPATAPTPAPAPEPARAPRAVIVSPDYDWSRALYIDGDRIRLDAERMARESLDRSVQSTQRAEEAMERARAAMDRDHERMTFRTGDIEARIADSFARSEDARIRAQESAERALARVGDTWAHAYVAPMAQIGVDIATSIASTVGDGYKYAYSYSPSITTTAPLAYAPGQSRWEWGQDPDPADSLFRVAYDAMNRGDYRRSAELFAQVQSKYPKSNRVASASYNEALMRYKLGTLEELRTALRLLTDKSKTTGTTSSSFMNEVNNMTMRVRGALAQRGDGEQQRIVAAEAQKGGCDREDQQVRAEALSAVANSDMTTATPMLRRVLEKKDPCSLELRRSALRILLRRSDTAATSAAIAVAKNNDETLELRVDAINALSRLPGDNALSALEDLLRNSTDRDVQRAAVRALSNTENTRARSSVRMIVERSDVSEELRREALSTFSKERNNPDDGTYLRSLFPKMQSEALKRSVLAAISRMGGAENDQFLLSVARNTGESSEVRSEAISRLSRTTASITVKDLSALYDAAESRSLRNQIVNALGQRKEPEAVDKLIEIMKTSTDTSIRSQVIGMLGRSSDPKAKQAIIDFAGRP